MRVCWNCWFSRSMEPATGRSSSLAMSPSRRCSFVLAHAAAVVLEDSLKETAPPPAVSAGYYLGFLDPRILFEPLVELGRDLFQPLPVIAEELDVGNVHRARAEARNVPFRVETAE